MLLPYFFWRIKHYQHSRYAYGPLRAEYRSKMGQTYAVFGRATGLALLITVLFGVAMWLIVQQAAPGLFKRGAAGMGQALFLLVPLAAVYFVALNIASRAYWTASMQNLVWSRTGSRYFRFKSDLDVGKFIGLQFKNYALIVLTLGLYWPFAVIATKGMLLRAVTLRSRVELNELVDMASKPESDAAGDMAADVLDLDMGI